MEFQTLFEMEDIAVSAFKCHVAVFVQISKPNLPTPIGPASSAKPEF